MRPHRAAEASAPTRVDLAGGTLDIWPLYLLHPGAVTVNAAIDRRAWCRVEPAGSGVRVESKDTLQKWEGESVAELLRSESPPLAAWVLHALGVESGVRVVTHARVPAGSGLGGSSALAVAMAGAAARSIGRELPAEELWPLVRDAEAQSLAMPAGMQDHLAALHGGVLAVHLLAGRVRAETLAVDPAAVEECLLLASSGGTRFSGINNWEVFKARVDGNAATRDALGRIAEIAAGVARALSEGRLDEVPALLKQEWEQRRRLAPGVSTPEIDRIVAVAEAHGGAAKVCGAGGGGVVALWASPGARGPGAREALVAGLQEAGVAVFPFRLDLRGLEVEEA